MLVFGPRRPEMWERNLGVPTVEGGVGTQVLGTGSREAEGPGTTSVRGVDRAVRMEMRRLTKMGARNCTVKTIFWLWRWRWLYFLRCVSGMILSLGNVDMQNLSHLYVFLALSPSSQPGLNGLKVSSTV